MSRERCARCDAPSVRRSELGRFVHYECGSYDDAEGGQTHVCKPDVIPLRKVTIKGVTYFRAKDIANYIRIFAATEPNDTADRLEEAAKKFDEVNGLKQNPEFDYTG